MTTGLIIWIIGWLFTFGIASEALEFKEEKDFLFKIFSFLVCSVMWPIFLGQSFYNTFLKDKEE